MTFIAKAMERAGSTPASHPKPLNPAETPAGASNAEDDTLTFVGRAMEASGESASPTAAVLRPAKPVTPAASRPAAVRAEPRMAPRQVSKPMVLGGSDPSDTRRGISVGWVVLGFGFLAIVVGFFALPGGSDQTARPIATSGDSPAAAAVPAQNVRVAIPSRTAPSVAMAPSVATAAKVAEAAPLVPPVSRVKATIPVIERQPLAPASGTGPVAPLAAKSVALGAVSAVPVERAASIEVPAPAKVPPSVKVSPPVKVPPPVQKATEVAPVEISEPAVPKQNPMAMLEFYNLEGIFFTETDPAAIINDRIVDPGDTIGDLTVIEIRRNSVIVEIAGRRLELR